MDTDTRTTGPAHTFNFGPIYDGRCMQCECRYTSAAASDPCPSEY